jgi:serpin B
MPYAGDSLSMVVLLPRTIDGLKGLEDMLSAEELTSRLDGIRKREVRVCIPKFTMTAQFELAKTLGAMGMPEAFSGAADFSGMTGGRDLYISAVVHKAFVEVNEEGTEAAAATGVAMRLTAAPAPPPLFRADHPFLFLIRHNPSGSILFLGRITRPHSSR